MRLSVLLKTQEFRGDHSANVSVVYEPVDDETVVDLAKRLLRVSTDVLEIRLVQPCSEYAS